MALNPKIGLSSGSLITKKGTCNSSTVLLDSSKNLNLYRSTHGTVSLDGYPTDLVACHMDLTVSQLLTFWLLVSYSPTTYAIAGTIEHPCQAKPM